MRLAALFAAASLSGCGPLPPIDWCKGSGLRRNAYEAVINAVSLSQAAGYVVSPKAILAKDAAVVALTALNRRCPVSL